ncbi:uncharacterized protein Z518_10939 [Rhinocladiella mackenziei CBS 650.93]|uniref:Rhinocladiella mackenziei CBS 650.93 unplaced genomic scaffold supercont1.10, whole genome shotgun sequence n=1 Tax=Rhinocladiella mackenziei CBS 650.93 TaxID=1442369 RepID=A0A0D2FD80_9EURO|nr:uncharacterized protein Z518_10939 [Rhinocladiella mackenziei CBS 650.93]KIX00012.1 hypothetical protein Z518_10939 [Rhinocladiella mackenziei CBS 650.93]
MSNPPKGRSAGGVLPVNAAARKNATAQSGSKSSQRTPAPRLRLIIRRLPPGLTEPEFWTILGDDWKVGAGKVEWAAFKEGKISKDPAKPSRPSRAYLKVKEQSVLDDLSAAVKQSSFQDAKNTSKDPCLLGPPSLEFAPYNKTPSGRVRHDGRQGTIDQDQEFIDFLQSLTEPISKASANGADAGDIKQEKVSTTPLVQYIKEKKANKAKEVSQTKAAKARESREAKSAKSETRSKIIIKGQNEPAPDKERGTKATQDAVKGINKSAAAMQGKQTPTKAEAKQSAKEKDTPPQPTPAKRERERGSVSAAARMLQRDLGLVAKESKSQRTPKTAASTGTAETEASSSAKPAPVVTSGEPEPSVEQKPSTPATPTTAPPTGPRSSRTPTAAPPKNQGTPAQRPSKASPQPSSGAKSAFLKHANQSQGVTEEALQTAFKEFGTITRCEIDKKKGLGYIDFSETEGLKKAMAASPVKVANGQVVVLENKSQQGKRGGQGHQSQGAQKAAANPAASASTPTAAAAASSPGAATTPPAASSADVPKDETSATATAAGNAPPTAPRGSARGGAGGGRSGRGGSSGGRGNSRGSGQGPRQGHRGGRNSGKRGGGGGGGAEREPASTAVSKEEMKKE